MKPKTYSPAVRAWAARKAREARRRADAIRTERFPAADWQRIRGKMRALEHLGDEAARLERIARADACFDDECGPF